MMLHPSILERAQAEIDDVVGADRLPNLADRPRLPYIDAIAKEVLRWRNVVPMGTLHLHLKLSFSNCRHNRRSPSGVAHRLDEDDEYKGYLIPKNSLILANIW